MPVIIGLLQHGRLPQNRPYKIYIQIYDGYKGMMPVIIGLLQHGGPPRNRAYKIFMLVTIAYRPTTFVLMAVIMGVCEVPCNEEGLGGGLFSGGALGLYVNYSLDS